MHEMDKKMEKDVGMKNAIKDMSMNKDKAVLTAMRNARMEKMAECKSPEAINEWKKGYNKEAGLEKGLLGRAVDKVKEVVGLGEKPVPVQAHSNNGVATTRKDINFTNVEAAENRYAKERPSIKSQEYETKHMKERPEHQSAISNTGAVREATTGKIYIRVNSEETVARKVENEQQERKAPVKQNVMSM